MKTDINNDGELTIKLETCRDGSESGVCVTLNLFRMFDDMNDEQKLRVAEALTWGVVLQQAVERLKGDSRSWCGDDRNLSAEVMEAISEHAMPSHDKKYYFWRLLNPLRDLASKIEHGEALYWKLYHDLSPLPAHGNGDAPSTVGDLFRLVLKRPRYVCGHSGFNNERPETSPVYNHSERFEAFQKQVIDLIESKCAEQAKAVTQ